MPPNPAILFRFFFFVIVSAFVFIFVVWIVTRLLGAELNYFKRIEQWWEKQKEKKYDEKYKQKTKSR